MTFALVLCPYWRFERFFLLGVPCAALRLYRVAAHGCQHDRRLLATHHGDARIGPHPEKARTEGASAHPIITGAIAAADDHRELGHLRAGDGGDELRAVTGDSAGFVFLSH